MKKTRQTSKTAKNTGTLSLRSISRQLVTILMLASIIILPAKSASLDYLENLEVSALEIQGISSPFELFNQLDLSKLGLLHDTKKSILTMGVRRVKDQFSQSSFFKFLVIFEFKKKDEVKYVGVEYCPSMQTDWNGLLKIQKWFDLNDAVIETRYLEGIFHKYLMSKRLHREAELEYMPFVVDKFMETTDLHRIEDYFGLRHSLRGRMLQKNSVFIKGPNRVVKKIKLGPWLSDWKRFLRDKIELKQEKKEEREEIFKRIVPPKRVDLAARRNERKFTQNSDKLKTKIETNMDKVPRIKPLILGKMIMNRNEQLKETGSGEEDIQELSEVNVQEEVRSPEEQINWEDSSMEEDSYFYDNPGTEEEYLERMKQKKDRKQRKEKEESPRKDEQDQTEEANMKIRSRQFSDRSDQITPPAESNIPIVESNLSENNIKIPQGPQIQVRKIEPLQFPGVENLSNADPEQANEEVTFTKKNFVLEDENEHINQVQVTTEKTPNFTKQTIKEEIFAPSEEEQKTVEVESESRQKPISIKETQIRLSKEREEDLQQGKVNVSTNSEAKPKDLDSEQFTFSENDVIEKEIEKLGNFSKSLDKIFTESSNEISTKVESNEAIPSMREKDEKIIDSSLRNQNVFFKDSEIPNVSLPVVQEKDIPSVVDVQRRESAAVRPSGSTIDKKDVEISRKFQLNKDG